MRIGMVAPPDNLSGNVAAGNLLRLDSAPDENLEPKTSNVLSENLHGLRGSNGQRPFAETTNEHFFFVWNLELKSADRAKATILQFPQPLMRDLEILQHWRRIDAPDFLSPPERSPDA